MNRWFQLACQGWMKCLTASQALQILALAAAWWILAVAAVLCPRFSRES